VRIGVLASHRGSGLRAILEAIEAGTLAAEIVLVISNNSDAPALAIARDLGIAAHHLSATRAGGAEAADRAIAELLGAREVDLVVLAGYLRKLGPLTLTRFAGRVVNLHPSLLPRHGGPGKFGRHVHASVLASGDRTSGATVHVVDAEYDQGPVLARATVPVLPDDTIDSLTARVQAIEPGLLVDTLCRIADGTLVLPGQADGGAESTSSSARTGVRSS
jgi:phosphoribosylglycinamide formyltransferase-1